MIQWVNFEGPTFTLQVPSTWVVKANPQFQAMFIAEKEDEETIFPSLTIAILPSENTLADHFTQVGTLQAEEYPRYEVVEEQQMGESFRRISQWFHMPSSTSLWQVQQFFTNPERGSAIYTVTATYLPQQADRVSDSLATMLDSFAFK